MEESILDKEKDDELSRRKRSWRRKGGWRESRRRGELIGKKI